MINNKEENLKIILLGITGCGKTSIISRYINGTFDYLIDKTNSASYSCKSIKIENRAIALDIWDTSGEQIYRDLTEFFYKDADAIVLVYDITNKRKFEDLKNYWFSKLKESVPKEASKKKIKLYKYLN